MTDKPNNKEDLYYGGRASGGSRPDRKPNNRPRTAPMQDGFALYYIAALCPSEVNNEINLFKNYMQDKYGSRAAQKSPAHFTIIPPFKTSEETETAMRDFVMTYNFGLVPFEVQLQNFGHFDNKVLYVDVTPSESLNNLEADANVQFGEQFPTISFRTKPDFHPHVTIATRDIPEQKFPEIWEHFSQQQFTAGFSIKELSLMKLVRGVWEKM